MGKYRLLIMPSCADYEQFKTEDSHESLFSNYPDLRDNRRVHETESVGVGKMGNPANCLVFRIFVILAVAISFVSGAAYRKPLYKRQANLNVDQLQNQDQQTYEKPKPPTQEHLDLLDNGQFDQKPSQEQEKEKQPAPQGGEQKDVEDEVTIDAGGRKPDAPTPKEEHKPGDPFSFEYNVNDKNGNEFSRKEESDGEVVKGEYRTLMPDGRWQIVSYTADWKNGYRANVTYEPATPPPTTKRPGDEGEEDIQPGANTPKPNCIPDTKGGKGSYDKPGMDCPDEGGQTLKPPKKPTCAPGVKGSADCEETEQEILPEGQTPKPPKKPPCAPGVKGSADCEETEVEILPEGQTPKPPCVPGVKGGPPCPGEDEKEVLPGEQSTPKPPPGLYGTPSQPYKVRMDPKFGYSYDKPSPSLSYDIVAPLGSYEAAASNINPKVTKRSTNERNVIRPRNAIFTRTPHGFKYFLI